jgi:hypothetical protein
MFWPMFLGVAGLLVPMIAPGESRVQTGGGSLSAAAHLDFRIIIPEVLYLNTRAGDAIAAPVAVFSNGRNVALSTTVRGAETLTAHLILSGAGRRGITRTSACGTAIQPADGAVRIRLVCTASTP